MTDLAPQNREHRFILSMALLQGVALLLIWLWVDTLSNARQYFNVILPLYVLAISLPLSLMLLAHQPRKLALSLAGAFSLIAAFCAMYFGDVSYVKGLPRYGVEGLVFQFGFCMVMAWFIAVTFIEHFCQYGRWSNHYESLYDYSWRNAVKLITSGIFTGLFWAALLLLAGLFKVLGITFFKTIIEDVYFIYPATAVAFGLGISLYNAKQDALSEFKRAILQVLGWLLPLVSLILLAFMITLPFKGLASLWGTGYATSLMLSLLALMVFLLNTAFQDGKQTQYPAWLLKLSNLAVLTMPIYAMLCIYALYLRVNQYGWTDDRVWAASITLIMAIYSVGYAFAAFQSFNQNTWIQAIKPVNVIAAVCLMAFIGLLYSPILSPMRIGVQSQLARLHNGTIAASQFDYEYLRFSGGKYGEAALKNLLADTTHPQAATIKPLVEATLKAQYRHYRSVETKKPPVTLQTLQAHFNIYPKGTPIEAAFFERVLQEYQNHEVYFACLDFPQDTDCANTKPKDQLLAVDLNQDGHVEIVFFQRNGGGRAYKKEANSWIMFAHLNNYCCEAQETTETFQKNLQSQLEAGEVTATAPQWQDLKVGNKKYQLNVYR